MTIDDKSPALSGKLPPATEEEAVSRVANLTAEGMDGLIGTVYQSIDQFQKAMQDGGWHLDLPVYAQSETATTWIGTARRREREVKLILNSYGASVEVVNCFGGKEDEKPKKPEPMSFKLS